ncbi:L,D-transpeptidase family protein [Desulfuromonas sp. TF]|uniref:L,D-transpeptidase family protein n=1 Tax=Desulfuromonas sp. TF TaxID=1232410 RepID=UPI000424B657|nr:L,D-transpeptidase family protein [Desulfuromonas sp. TF]
MRGGFFCALCASFCMLPSPLLCWYPQSPAEAFLRDEIPSPVVGTAATSSVEEGDTLTQIARAKGVGYDGLVRANPGVDPWLPEPGLPLLLPYTSIVPGPLTSGITVNLAEMRLYHLFRENGRLRVRIYPVGIGISGWETPEGVFTISNRVEKPTWIVPHAIGLERPELPPTVPPGPENPLGDFWLGLSRPGYGIHGTSEPFGVGRRVSHGCLRLYPEDIRDLFERVEIGTPVRIIYQPVKVGLKRGALFVEIHHDYSDRLPDPVADVSRQIGELGWRGEIDWKTVGEEVETARGVPRVISREAFE